MGGVVFHVNWRRGPRELRQALGEARRQMMCDIATEIERTAPHESIRRSVRASRARVIIDHPAAWFWEVGWTLPAYPVTKGPPARLVVWGASRGKSLREAFAVARAGITVPAQPYITPAIAKVLSQVGATFRSIWRV